MLKQAKQPTYTTQRSGVFVVTLGYMFATLMSTSSYASDLDIYQPPAQGQKTLIMMLDTSGSMGSDGTQGGGDSIYNDYGLSCTPTTVGSGTTPAYNRKYCTVAYSATAGSTYQRLKTSCEVLASNGGLRCYDRITRLKDGMFSVLNNSTDTTLNPIFMGVGNFSARGDGSSGQILVPAAALGAAGSQQRINLETAIAGLSASNGTPSAHAYAEAAAYLMGTKTASLGTPYTINKQMWYKAVPGSAITDRTTYYGKCVGWASIVNGNPGTELCNQTIPNSTTVPYNSTGWQSAGTVDPTVGQTISTTSTVTGSANTRYTYTIYSISYKLPNYSDGNSGFYYSTQNNNTYPGIVNSTASAYVSPLPSNLNLACGQGVYFLSDGQPNSSSTSEATTVMGLALNTSYSSCPTSGTYLPNTVSDSAWNCIGDFAQRLYDKTRNPTGVKIQTAFVGFGKDFSGLATAAAGTDVVNACKLGSRLTASSTVPSDACSTDVTNTTLKNVLPGYGNGVFVAASTPSDVNLSVNNFIQSLGDNVITPLVTGSPTIPIDDLNPNGFQAYGYLRQLEPNPAKPSMLLWRGNVKKYALAGGAIKDRSGNAVVNADGSLRTLTTDLWNPSTGDGAIIDQGGAYSRVVLPVTGSATALRPLFTDIATVNTTTGVTTAVSNGSGLTNVIGTITNALSDIPNRFGATAQPGVSPMKDLSLTQKLSLINYLGFNLPVTTTAAIPTVLTAPAAKFNTMGGSIHAQPIQLTYSAALLADGTLGARTESVLYGSMEGALHLVDAGTGAEQMVFVPKDILDDSVMQRGLRQGEVDSTTVGAPTQGVDGPWVADPTYKTNKGGSLATSSIIASKMNVYGGLRMSGSVWFGLDLLNKTAPKLLFRIDPTVTGFDRMGQSWSKPVLANVRYNNVITRVMIVGGGYDPRYEDPNYAPGTDVKGNTVYMINAQTGALLWHATQTNMTHSIVSRIGAIDRNADGLVDSLYYGDLGGQVFRSDFNNTFGTTTTNFGVRTVRLANLATLEGTSSQLAAGLNPRIYEAPTLTVHSYNGSLFLLVAVASGNRSSPIDVIPVSLGGAGLTDRKTNKVYGIIDRDSSIQDLTTNALTTLTAHDRTLANMVQNPQTALTGVIATNFWPTTGVSPTYDGWYRSLSTNNLAVEVSGKTPGGMKAVEDLIALTGTLYVNVYDPEGTNITPGNACDPRVVGETTLEYFCLPYGVCTVGDPNSPNYGTKIANDGGPTGYNPNKLLGAGIVATNPGDNDTHNNPNGTPAACRNTTLIGNSGGTGNWRCTVTLQQNLWYERRPDATKVQ
jgi:type IV pilus assembly protein PilY1